MSTINASFSRDNNRVPITNLGIIVSKTITYDAATTGATGATTLFTVTGTVCCNLLALCTSDLTSGGSATIEAGTSSSTACLANQVVATTIDNHEIWHNGTLAVGGTVSNLHVVNENIIQTIGTTTITGGSLIYYCYWNPLSSDGNVVTA